MLPYGRQSVSEEDIASVVETLRSPFLTQGPKIEEFEKAICDLVGAKHCVAVSNGTAALHIAVAAMGLPEGAEGITSPVTFTASANCMLYCGVKPRFADIDPESYCLSPSAVEAKIDSKTKLLIPVHFAGRPCDMEAFASMARKRGLRVIEDAAHAIGSRFPDGSMVGSCKRSDMTIFSFHPVKTITCGEGGAVTTNDDELYQRLLLFRSHGITKAPGLLEANPGPWHYEMRELGFNYRLTDFQAALGSSQLKRLESFTSRRLEIVKAYNKAFAGNPALKTPSATHEDLCCFHLYALQIDFKRLGVSRAEAMAFLKERGVGTQVHYIPVHTQPYYRSRFGYGFGDCPVAEAYFERALSLPLYPAMSDADVETVVSAVEILCRGANG